MIYELSNDNVIGEDLHHKVEQKQYQHEALPKISDS